MDKLKGKMEWVGGLVGISLDVIYCTGLAVKVVLDQFIWPQQLQLDDMHAFGLATSK